MFDYPSILLWLAGIMLVIGSYTDIRWRIVPDWLSYSAIVAGFVVRLMYSIITVNWYPIVEGLVGFGIFFVLACVAFYTKVWGGGDSKVLMALGSLIGIWWIPDHLMFALLTNFLLVGGLYGLGYFIVLGVAHFTKVKNTASMLLSQKAVATFHAIVYVVLGLFIVAGLVLRSFSFTVLGLGFVMIFYMFILSKSIEKACFIKDQPLSKVEEGDWVIEAVVVKGRTLASPKDPGITQEQIDEIKRLSKKHHIKTIKIKEGIPFIPNFLITFLVTLYFGNIVFIIMGIL